MLKRDITYEDFNGDEVTDTYYFNLTKTELMTLGSEFETDYEKILQRIIETKDRAGLIKEFKRIILSAYGEKSEDGKRFIKNDELREKFSQTPAYDIMFMEFATNAEKAADFINAVFPKDLAEEVQKEMAKTIPIPPPSLRPGDPARPSALPNPLVPGA